jgi:peptidoglycan/xylan/chitin deacetylase (PgdA/CDA1 family)
MVRARSFIKSAFPVAARFTGLSRALALRYRGQGAIFALHSIVDDTGRYPDQTLRCPARKLAFVLRWLRRRGVEFVTLDAAIERLRSPSGRRFAVFTFDDGFADNLTRALPIMQQFAAPFTVFVTTGMVTRTIDAWWFGLAELIRSQTHIEFPCLSARFDYSDPQGKQRTFAAIEAAIHKDFSLLAQLRALISASRIECSALVDREALTPAQLQELARHPLVTIGAHTSTHRNLAEASAGSVHWEMDENRKFLQRSTGLPVEHFAYPFGHARACGEREAQIAKTVGFRTAVTTRHGMLFPQHLEHLYALPRVHLACDDTPASLDCKLNGVYRAVHSRFADPVARM